MTISKKHFVAISLLSLLCLVAIFFLNKKTPTEKTADTTRELDNKTKMEVDQAYGKLPLHFEPNVGQTHDSVDFVSRGQGYTLYLTNGEPVLALSQPKDENETQQSDMIRIKLSGANTSPKVKGTNPLPGKSNYLLGNDPSKWYTDIPHYRKVEYSNVYPGIDLVYYGTEQRLLEHDFVVSPGVNPDVIQFSIEGAKKLTLDDSGNLIASTQGGDVVLQAPVTYQDIDGKRIPVESQYTLANDLVGFELAAYDVSQSVVIDPVLSYSTYLGGSGFDRGRNITIDGSGNAYLTGTTESTDFPLQSPFQATHGGGSVNDVFVSVLNSSGSALIYSTYLGGSDSDISVDIALDGTGNAYVTGNTRSTNFPLQSPFQATHGGGSDDAFVFVLNSSGSALIYSTYLGGSDSESGLGIAVDGSGNAYIAGRTSSTNFPLQSPFQATHGGGSANDAFVSVLNSSGSALIYSTYLGGSTSDNGNDIAIDGSGNAYITGNTSSTNFPLQSPFQATYGGGSTDAFVSVLNSSGSALIYSTYLGGSNLERGDDIAIDGSGNAYITGNTSSTNFPLQSPFQATHGGGSTDAFVSVLNSSGSALIYSTYLGGSSSDSGVGITLDGSGNAYIIGNTQSTNFPVQAAFQTTYGGAGLGLGDAFVSALNSSGSALIYSTYLGGSGGEFGIGIALDGFGNTYVIGDTESSNFPVQAAFQTTYGGGLFDAFVSKLVPGIGVSIPDTTATYGTQVLVPIRITDPSGLGVVAAEISVTFDNSVVTLGSPDKTDLTNTLVAVGWSVEENVFPGVGGIDTLTIAMSTAADTLSLPGDLINIVLDVTSVRQPASTPLDLISVLFNDGAPQSHLTDGSLTVIGTDGTIVAAPDTINPGDVITVTVTDTDFDVDVGSADQITATALGKLYNDTQTLVLTETGVNTGIFTGTVNTIFATVADPSQNGVVGTIAGDEICVSFVDSLTSAGTAQTRQDTVDVVGGTDGSVITSFVVQALDGRNGVRDTVRVQITDPDLDLSVGIADQVSATITNTISLETETVTLTETNLSTGIFQVRVPTISGPSGISNDGELSLVSSDLLDVVYNDALDAQGGTTARKDTTQVVNLFGDVRVNDQVQAFDAARLLAISVGLITANTQTTLVGDVDGNNAIQAFDASNVLQYVVRLIDRFTVQTDFTPDPKNHPFEKPVPLGNVIALGQMQPQNDGTYLLPVRLSERSGILSGTFTFGLDQGIEVIDVDLTNDFGSFMVAHNMTTDGLKVAFAGSQSDLTGTGDVLLLSVRNKDNAPIHLSLDYVVLNGQTLTPSVNIEALEEVITQAPELITTLHQNIPNPFNPQTTINYALADAGQVEIVIYSVTGQRIRTLLNEFQAAGSYQMVWDGKDAIGRNVSSGIYFLQMNAGTFNQTRKMMLLR